MKCYEAINAIRASVMPWIKLFETLVNGLSILDYCRRELRPRG